ncbi:DoxX family protein [Paraliomyxa miuraensis]|uniref:DoxX family protein n=1 Tax=Paraliomyxa miuraensis TaxID=376150 RepID=UPI002258FED9|nr:DoxX family protein [Paraliomyxa miuraensis]MCX4240307.1 DoxX family protein [Paraliomyxa miuraensis]
MDPTKPAERPEPHPLFKAGQSDSPITLTALRVGVGSIMVVHGWLKLTDAAAWKDQVVQLGMPAPELTAWLAIAGELLGGAGLVVGLLTPLAGLGVLATMITAIATVHLGHGLLAKDGGYEYPLTIALVAAFFIMRGAGPYSIDALLSGRRPRVHPDPREGSTPPMHTTPPR